MNTLLHYLLQDLARHEGLALLVSALLTSSGIVCVAAATAMVLRHRSARARSLVWRLGMSALLIAGGWKLAPDASPPVAVVEWQVDWSPLPAATPVLPAADVPPFVLPGKPLSEHVCTVLDDWAVRVWLGVAALWLLGRVAGVVLGLHALARRSAEAPAAVVRAGGEAGLPPQTRYRLTEGLGSPMLTGWRRPLIWLPSEAAAWDAARMSAVLRHEAAHWQRKDWLWQWLAQAAVCLWWWQPLAWLARGQLRMEAEHAADDMAVAGPGQTADYARMLVEVAAGLRPGPKNTLGVTMLSGEGVKKRVHALMHANRWRGRIGVGALVALALVTVALSVLVATKVEFAPQKLMYRSTAKLVAGGRAQGPDWREQMQDFYGTIIETLESSEMKRRAHERVKALHPDMNGGEIEIQVAQTKGTAIFNVLATGEEPKFAKAFLDALLDEFIAWQQSIREQLSGRAVQALLKETVSRQKMMEERNIALTRFAEANNFLANTNQNNQLAQSLAALTKQRQDTLSKLDELKLEAEDIPAAIADAELRAKAGQPLTSVEADYVKAASELRALAQKRQIMQAEFKTLHPEVTKVEEQAAVVERHLASLDALLRGQIQQRRSRLERQLAQILSQIEEQQAAALAIGSKIARHDQLKDEAATAKQAYEKLFSQVQSHAAALSQQSEYVAIQERASPAAAQTTGGLLPIWKLWRKTVAAEPGRTAAR